MVGFQELMESLGEQVTESSEPGRKVDSSSGVETNEQALERRDLEYLKKVYQFSISS